MRGYILIEAVIGGVLAASVLGGVVTIIGGARAQQMIAARESTAAQLVTEKLEETRAKGFGIDPGVSIEDPVDGMAGRYVRKTTVDAEANETIGGTTMRMQRITVQVTFKPAGGITVKREASVKLYADP